MRDALGAVGMMTAELERCDGITLKGRQCKRMPTVDFVKDDIVVAHYCPQHANGMGVMRYLRPFPWDAPNRRRCEYRKGQA